MKKTELDNVTKIVVMLLFYDCRSLERSDKLRHQMLAVKAATGKSFVKLKKNDFSTKYYSYPMNLEINNW